MFTKLSFTIITLLIMASLAGCSAKSPTATASSPTESISPEDSTGTYTETNASDNSLMLPLISGNVANVVLDTNADGTTQQLKKGEVLAVILESNPSTGYSWFAIISNPSVLVQMGEPVYQEPSSSSSTPVVGAAGTQTFYFQAIEIGSTTLTLDYKRSFETNVAPDKTVTINVEVQ